MPRDGILMSIGNLPASLSQRILVGIILVGRLGASKQGGRGRTGPWEHLARRTPVIRVAWIYGQSPYWESGFRRVWLKQNLNCKGWNSHVHRGFLQMLSQQILVGIIWVGRLGVGERGGQAAEGRARVLEELADPYTRLYQTILDFTRLY